MGKISSKNTFTVEEIREYRRQYRSMKASGAKTALFKRMIMETHDVGQTAVGHMLTCKCYEWIDEKETAVL